MTSLEPKELMLEIIARLRSRKARPDLIKISHMAKRKYGLSNKNTEEMLNKLVDDGIVNKVSYKGQISYRNAAKCSKNKSTIEILNKKASAKLRNAIHLLSLAAGNNNNTDDKGCGDGGLNLNNKTEGKIINDSNNNNESSSTGGRNLFSQEGDGDELKLSASLSQIEKWWHEQSFDAALDKIDLNDLIMKEIAARRIKTLPNGNYVSCRGGRGSTSSAPHQPVAKKPLLSAVEKRPTTASNKTTKNDAGDATNNIANNSENNVVVVVSAAKTNSIQKIATPKPPCKRGRPASKRKKFLKNHGPDFQAEMPVAILGIDKCDFCFQPAEGGPLGENESLLPCNDCSTKAHLSCMNYSPELALRAQQFPWQCINCKVCNVCQESGSPEPMLICCSCYKGFHIKCLEHPVDKEPIAGVLAVVSEDWLCSLCDNSRRKETPPPPPPPPSFPPLTLTDTSVDIKDESCTYKPLSPCESPELRVMHFSNVDNFGELQKRRGVYDGPYPNVTNFTVDDIVQFFKSKGFEKESHAFSEQEIDGKSLLLMKRDDVLMGLRDYICLGPALKIFKHVERLQWASD